MESPRFPPYRAWSVIVSRSVAPLPTLLIFMLAAFCGIPEAAANFGTTGNVNLLLGAKHVGYSGTGDQRAASLDAMCGIRGFPVLLDAYSGASWGKGQNSFDDPITEARYETGGGLMGIWRFGSFFPHVGSGWGRITMKAHIGPGGESGERRFEETDSHRWTSWGGFWRFPSGINLGLAVRSSVGHQRYPELGGTHYGLTLGWGWPGKP